jgi:hypothetical protein
LRSICATLIPWRRAGVIAGIRTAIPLVATLLARADEVIE